MQTCFYCCQWPRLLELRAEVSPLLDSEEALLLVAAAPTADCANFLAVALLLSSKGFLFDAVGGRGVLLGGAAHFGLPGLALLQCLLASAGQHEAASADRRRVQMVPPQAGRLHGVLLQRAAFIAVGRQDIPQATDLFTARKLGMLSVVSNKGNVLSCECGVVPLHGKRRRVGTDQSWQHSAAMPSAIRKVRDVGHVGFSTAATNAATRSARAQPKSTGTTL
ncbi:MAG: hypothetical protein FRX49_04019 [Trebouxia sp. A1-2]|nr:MAG: hypothetical protein FRX49_04019 [Trebouxia sp. A1-2]